MRLWQLFELTKHAVGAALMIHCWPSRRYMAKLRAEVEAADQEAGELRSSATMALACGRAVVAEAEQALRPRPRACGTARRP